MVLKKEKNKVTDQIEIKGGFVPGNTPIKENIVFPHNPLCQTITSTVCCIYEKNIGLCLVKSYENQEFICKVNFCPFCGEKND